MLDCPSLSAASRPGQFVMARCSTGLDPYLRYPLPIHRISQTGISLLFRPHDDALRWLGTRPIGELVSLLGPCGRGLDLPSAGTIGLIAQGMGIAWLLSALDRTRSSVRLVLKVPTASQVYPAALLPAGVEYLPFVGARDHKAFLSAVESTAQWAQRICASGSESLYQHLRRTIEYSAPGMRRNTVFVRVEADLACGLGACQVCTVETVRGARRACVDGPFFDLAELLHS